MGSPFAAPADPVKGLLVGYPGSWKTGSLIALAEAGFKLRVLDYDGNIIKLFKNYCRPDVDVDIYRLHDAWVMDKQQKKLRPRAMIESWRKGLLALDNWTYTDPLTGEKVDKGRPTKWGPDHVIVIDSATRMGEACVIDVKAHRNGVDRRTEIQDWGEAGDHFRTLCQILKGPNYGCNVLILNHLKLVEPDLPDVKKLQRELDDRELAEVVAELRIKSAQLAPAKLFPSALGRAVPMDLPSMFEMVLYFGINAQNKNGEIFTKPTPQFDWIKVPAPIQSDRGALSAKTGLLKIFESQGVHPPQKEKETTNE